MQVQRLHGHRHMSKFDSHVRVHSPELTLSAFRAMPMLPQGCQILKCGFVCAVAAHASTSIGCLNTTGSRCRCQNYFLLHAVWVPAPVWKRPYKYNRPKVLQHKKCGHIVNLQEMTLWEFSLSSKSLYKHII